MTQPFGSTRAPANWGRVTALIQWILITYFGLFLPIYVDDCFLVEPAGAVESAYQRMNFLIMLCGFKLGKFSAPACSISLMGAFVSIKDDFVTAALPLERRDALISDIQEILRSGNLTPGQAAKLRGRLGFAQSMLFGKFGRVLLQPITNRQYSRATKGVHPLKDELREVLPWWPTALRNACGRRTWFRGPRPAVVYVDAAGCGHLGAVVYVDDERYIYPTHAPGRMATAQCDIYDYEMCTSLFGLCIAVEFLPGRAVILCGDNRGASQTLVRGACRSAFTRMTCAAFWSLAAPTGTPVWIEEVLGALNPSDPPSRDCTACNHPFSVPGKRCEVPNVFSRILVSKDTLKGSQFSIPAGPSGFSPSWECPSAQPESQ